MLWFPSQAMEHGLSHNDVLAVFIMLLQDSCMLGAEVEEKAEMSYVISFSLNLFS